MTNHGATPAIILGIETSCDETAASVVVAGTRVLSNVIASQADLFVEYGGVVPEIASRAHVERISPVVHEAVAQAGLTLDRIEAIAVGHRPGLIGALLVGVAAAKGLAWGLGVPLVGVDHIHAHLYAGLLETDTLKRTHRDAQTVYPALGLVVSGGHTAIYHATSPIELTRLGATIDDAIGEAYDKAATIMGLPYPGGPHLDRLARDGDPRSVDLPISRLKPDSLDFSFSGLKTAFLYAVRGRPSKGGKYARDHTDLTDHQRRDLAASFQRAAVGAVLLKLDRALTRVRAQNHDIQSLCVGGGVSANSLLRKELTAFAQREGLALRLPPITYCLDNAAMIAGLGWHLLNAGRASDLSLQAVPTTAC